MKGKENFFKSISDISKIFIYPLIAKASATHIISSFTKRANEISAIITSFYISQMSNITLNNDLPFNPLKKLIPNAAPNKAFEDIKKVIEELVMEVVNCLNPTKYLSQIEEQKLIQETEKQQLNQIIERTKRQLEKITFSYYQELNSLREQLYPIHKRDKQYNVAAKYFNIEDGLSDEVCTLLNARIKEVKSGIENKLREYHIKILELTSIIKKYEMLTPKDYPLVKKNLVDLFWNIRKIYDGDRMKLRDELIKGMGDDYLESLFQGKFTKVYPHIQ